MTWAHPHRWQGLSFPYESSPIHDRLSKPNLVAPYDHEHCRQGETYRLKIMYTVVYRLHTYGDRIWRLLQKFRLEVWRKKSLVNKFPQVMKRSSGFFVCLPFSSVLSVPLAIQLVHLLFFKLRSRQTNQLRMTARHKRTRWLRQWWCVKKQIFTGKEPTSMCHQSTRIRDKF